MSIYLGPGRRSVAARSRGAAPRRRAARRRGSLVRARRPHAREPPARGDADADADADDDDAARRKARPSCRRSPRSSTALQSPPFMTVGAGRRRARHRQRHDGAGAVARGVDRRSARRRAPGARRGRRTHRRARSTRRSRRTRRSSGPPADQTADVLQRELHDAHLKLAPDATKQIAAHLGDDAGRVPELVELLHATYGDDATLSLDEVEQYLGELGTAGPLRPHQRDRPGRRRLRARDPAPHAHRRAARRSPSRCTRCR